MSRRKIAVSDLAFSSVKSKRGSLFLYWPYLISSLLWLPAWLLSLRRLKGESLCCFERKERGLINRTLVGERKNIERASLYIRILKPISLNQRLMRINSRQYIPCIIWLSYLFNLRTWVFIIKSQTYLLFSSWQWSYSPTLPIDLWTTHMMRENLKSSTKLSFTCLEKPD